MGGPLAGCAEPGAAMRRSAAALLDVPRAERYAAMFARHRSATIPKLWPDGVQGAYSGVDGDAAVEPPTCTGKR